MATDSISSNVSTAANQAAIAAAAKAATAKTTTPVSPMFVPAGTVNTSFGPIQVNSIGRAADGSMPVAASVAYTSPVQPAQPAQLTPTITNTVKNADGTIVTIYSDGSYKTSGTPTSAVPAITPGGSANANPSALGIITDALNAAGLGALASSAWTMWNKGYDINAIMDDPVNGIRASDTYKNVFPAMAKLNAMGQGISESEYIAKATADKELMKQYGLPTGVFDTAAYIGSLMTNNVTTADLQKRLIAVQNSVNSLDPNIVKYAKDTFGIGSGDLMAWALDPTKALPVIEQQAQAMQIGGAALASGFVSSTGTELAKQQALDLANAGVTQAQAQQGFTNIGQEAQFQQKLPGDVSGNLTDQQLINAQFGLNAQDTLALNKLKTTRTAEFQQGGAIASTQGGVTGIGAANLQA